MTQAAPGDLEQVRTFLNTWRIPNDTRIAVDELADLAGDVRRWTEAMPSIPVPASAPAVASLRSLRGELRDALGTARPVMLTAALERHGWRPVLSAPGTDPAVRFVPADRTPASVTLAVVVESIADGTWHRLRACPDCGWVFFDSSRNARRTWCSMTAAGGARGCGSIAKTRAYRARHR